MHLEDNKVLTVLTKSNTLKEYDYRTEGSRNQRQIGQISFESTLIHELGHILYRFHKEENWYKLSPEKACKRIRMTQEELNEEVKLLRKEHPVTPLKKLKKVKWAIT